MTCEYCGKTVGLLRRLKGTPFCSDAHAEAHKHEQEHGLLMSLLKPTILGASGAATAGIPEASPAEAFSAGGSTPVAPVPGHDEELASLAGALLQETFPDADAAPAPSEPLTTALQPGHWQPDPDPGFDAPPVCPFLIEAPQEQTRGHRWPPKTKLCPPPDFGPLTALPPVERPLPCDNLADTGVLARPSQKVTESLPNSSKLAPLVRIPVLPLRAIVLRSRPERLTRSAANPANFRHLATAGLQSVSATPACFTAAR